MTEGGLRWLNMRKGVDPSAAAAAVAGGGAGCG